MTPVFLQTLIAHQSHTYSFVTAFTVISLRLPAHRGLAVMTRFFFRGPLSASRGFYQHLQASACSASSSIFSFLDANSAVEFLEDASTLNSRKPPPTCIHIYHLTKEHVWR
jgi:hypothetical protein